MRSGKDSGHTSGPANVEGPGTPETVGPRLQRPRECVYIRLNEYRIADFHILEVRKLPLLSWQNLAFPIP